MLLGLNQTLVKIVNTGIHPLFQVGLRSLLASIPVLLFCFIFKKKLSISDGSLLPGIICGSLFGIEFVFLLTSCWKNILCTESDKGASGTV